MSLGTALNGYKVPLVVNAVTLVPIIAAMIAMYSDVQQLKADRLERVSIERIAKIEAQLQLGIDNRYRAGDAIRDFALRDQEIQRIKEDLRVLEDRMERKK